MTIPISAFDLAQRFIGLKEVAGATSNSQILAMLQLDAKWPENDETPWCSAFVNYVCWLLRLPRSKSLAARSWLEVGRAIDSLSDAHADFDVVILSRGAGGHVGFYGGVAPRQVLLLGGNQGDAVSLAPFEATRILGVRRLIV